MNDSTLLSIREFSKMAGIHQSALRYYDRIGLFTPAARGSNNYRYYTPVQLIKLKFITVLADLGIPLTKIKDLNNSRTPESVIDLLMRQEIKLDRQMHELRTAYSIIHTYRDNMQSGLNAREHESSVREEDMPDELYVIHGPAADFKRGDSFYEPFVNFCEAAEKNRINLNYPIGGYHGSMDGFVKAAGKPDRFFSFDPMGDSKIPAGRYLVGYARGYYGEFGDLPQRMASYARENGLAFKGAVYVLYLLDEVCTVNPDQYLARVWAGVTSAKSLVT